mmetsp:Transcript_16475/g.30161  ORF Transcript_16475/g.30161 Transcript_16475/m.30161 type:complete len:158 (-) Transcript_16475:884-1357(-)
MAGDAQRQDSDIGQRTWHSFDIRMYYEDTDFSGVVYHANYLKYFERARDVLMGLTNLREAFDTGVAAQVRKVAELKFMGAAKHGDLLRVETKVKKESDFRLVFQHRALIGDRVVVSGLVELVFFNMESATLVKVPPRVMEAATLAPPRHHELSTCWS